MNKIIRTIFIASIFFLVAPSVSFAETIAATVTYTCPSGSSLSGTSCAWPASQPAGIAATAYFTREGFDCGSHPACFWWSQVGPLVISSSYSSCPTGTVSFRSYYKNGSEGGGVGGYGYGPACAPSPSCPAGLRISATYNYYPAGGPGVITSACFGSQNDQTYYSCPSSYTLSGTTCYPPLVTPAPTAATPNYSCPSGYTLSGTSCTRLDGGTISVSSNISSSWTITGPATIIGSGTSQSSPSKPAGTYTITWNAAAGYTAPASQSLTLVAGNSITFTGNYSLTPCATGYTNPPSCSTCASGYSMVSGSCVADCTNGATNPSACTQCPSNKAYLSGFCIACNNGGCTGGGGSASNPSGTLSCNNGAFNPAFCNLCAADQTFVAPSCLANCTNGAINPTACNVCPASQHLDASNICVPDFTCPNDICEIGETIISCPTDCHTTVTEF